MMTASSPTYFGEGTSDTPRELAQEVEALMRDTRSKGYKDLRDRAAYMYITGTYPSHLRTFFTRALGLIARIHNRPVSLDGRSGNMKLDDNIVAKMDLANHPMVLKTREYVESGYRITVSRGANNRKPYTKIFLSKGNDEVTVQIDGSILDHWA